MTADVTAFVLTYGLFDGLDIGAAIPIERVDITAQTDAVVERLATQQNTTIHRFLDGSSRETFETSGSASGLGDILIRAKYQFLRGRAGGGLALGADVRLPTGEERDLLGTGTTLAGGFLIGSLQLGTFSPHINGGYTWSSNAPDPNEPLTVEASTIPNQVSYAAGFDWAIHPRVTFIVDVLGRTYLNSQTVTLVNQEYTAVTGDNIGGSCLCEPEGENPPRTIHRTFQRLSSSEANLDTLLGVDRLQGQPGRKPADHRQRALFPEPEGTAGLALAPLRARLQLLGVRLPGFTGGCCQRGTPRRASKVFSVVGLRFENFRPPFAKRTPAAC